MGIFQYKIQIYCIFYMSESGGLCFFDFILTYSVRKSNNHFSVKIVNFYRLSQADFCEQLVMYRNVRFNSPSRKFYLIYLRYSIRNA